MLRDLFSLFPAYAGVILAAVESGEYAVTFPRIRGGDPAITAKENTPNRLFPAYAGVILTKEYFKQESTTFPRIRGGDPQIEVWCSDALDFSPHTRG